MSSIRRGLLGRQQQRERRVGAGDDQEDVGVVEAAQEAADARRPGAAVVDRRGAEQQHRGAGEDRGRRPSRWCVPASTTRTMPATSATGVMPACSQPRSLGLTCSSGRLDALLERLAAARLGAGGRLGLRHSPRVTYATVGYGRAGDAPRPVVASRDVSRAAAPCARAVARPRLADGPDRREDTAHVAERRPVCRLRPPPHPAARRLVGARATSASCSTATAAGPRPAAPARARATRPAPTTSRTCCRGARRSASRSSPCGCSRPTTSTAPRRSCGPLLGSSRAPSTRLAATHRWRLHPVGALDLLPARTAARLKAAEDRTRDVDGLLVNVAVGYGGRREIADAVRSLLQEHADQRHLARGARRGHRRRAHRRAPLHQGPARPRPGHPHLGRAAARRASCSGRARTASSTSARPTGPTSARSTSCGRCAPTPSAHRRFGA